MAITLLAGGSSAGAVTLTYEKDVRPILKTNCFRCHGEAGELKGKLDLRLRRLILQGGKSGPEMVPGNAHDSRLYELVSTGKMPKGRKPLPEREIATIEQWIAQGALTARAEPLTPEHVFTEEERSWWAVQPVKRPPVPQVSQVSSNPIDAFLLARLADKALGFSLPADRVTLIRRATFDLTGLPPTPEEIDTFVADHSPLAYER